MKTGILSAIALLATSLATAASAGTPVAPVVTIKASGQGGWEILCHVTPTSGDETVRGLAPDRDTFATANIRRATCNYKNASTGPLTVSINSTAFACPFKLPAEAPCETQFGKSQFGSFELRRKS